jgi:hypothetical protein
VGSALVWGQTGSTYYAVHDGRIVALLYWSEPELGVEGESGEPLITAADWFWVAADDPHNHFQLDAPPLERGMTDAELAAAHDEALAAATTAISELLKA